MSSSPCWGSQAGLEPIPTRMFRGHRCVFFDPPCYSRTGASLIDTARTSRYAPSPSVFRPNFRPPDMGGTDVRYCLTFLKEVRNNICIT